MAESGELEASDPTRRFTRRVDDYVRARPGYPREVVDVLRDRAGFTGEWTVADVGSGTGISADLFLRHGNRVFAVEPNDAMRAAAESQWARHGSFRSVIGTAEATTLPAGSIDLIVAAQAFHWFDIDAFRAESLRIARPGGWALVMWNDRMTSGTPFLDGYEKLLMNFGTDYQAVQHRNIGADKLRRYFGGEFELIELHNEQDFDLEGLRARLCSSSYVPAEGHPRFAAMLASLRSLFDRHQAGGTVCMQYQTQLYIAQPS